MAMAQKLRLAPCWSNRTWEECCAVRSEWHGTGMRDCFPGVDDWQKCCGETDVPRDIFNCMDRGEDWFKLRRGVIFAWPLTDLPNPTVLRWRASECLLGALTASLLALATTGLYDGDGRLRERVEQAFAVAEDLLTLVLRSPISVNEILLSGWHLGAVLLFLRHVATVEAHAGPWLPDPTIGAEMRLMALLEALPDDVSLRIPQDLTFAAMLSPKSINAPVASAVAAWSAAVNLLREAWRTEGASEDQALEASTLLGLGQTQLKNELLRGLPAAPLKTLLAAPPFVLHLLQALHLQPLVHVDPLVGLPQLPEPLRTKAVPLSWQRGKAPLLELHPLPTDDSLSNAVRAGRQFVCGDSGFVTLISMLAKQMLAEELPWSKPPRLRFWEVGANQGDCSNFAVHMLSSWGRSSSQSRNLLQIEATLFEPVHESAVAARAAAAALLRRIKQAGAPPQRLVVRQLALGTKVGELTINLKRRASAQASFLGCHGLPGHCEVQQAHMETIDNLLAKEAEVLDVLKIHAQGYELDVLTGAHRALSMGRICLVFVLTSAMRILREGYMGKEAMDATVTSLRQLFSNYTARAVQLGVAETISIQEMQDRIGRSEDEVSRNYNVVAWHRGPRCRSRAAVRAAERLFGA